MISSKKGNLTHLALITAVACLSIGVIYGLLTMPLCWNCLSTKNVYITFYNDVYVPGHHFYCQKCQRVWTSTSPWLREPRKHGILEKI